VANPEDIDRVVRKYELVLDVVVVFFRWIVVHVVPLLNVNSFTIMNRMRHARNPTIASCKSNVLFEAQRKTACLDERA
jgi:hypothetical protein